MRLAIPALVLVHVELLDDIRERKPLLEHGKNLLARQQQVVGQRVQVLHVAERPVRGDHHPRLERAEHLELPQHAPGGAVAVVGPDVGMTVDVADEAGMHDAAVGQPHRDVAGIVGIVHVEQLDGLAAEPERHAVAEADHVVERVDVLQGVAALAEARAPRLDLMRLPARPILGDPVMDDNGRGRREQRRAAGMIAVVLGDDDVAHRLLRHRADEFLQDARLGRVVAGVHDDDTLRGHDDQCVGVVELADEGVDVVRDLLEFGFLAGDGVRRNGHRHRRANGHDGQRHASHESLPVAVSACCRRRS